jgi:DNA-binding MarR family transcriptional regulator
MVKPNNAVMEQQMLVRQILKLSEKIFHEVKLIVPSEWLSSDMTVAQLRVLLFIHTDGPSTMRTIASSLDVAISTATGIVNHLVKKDLVVRGEDPVDRRLVICSLSPSGKRLMDRIWTLGRIQIEKLLLGLSTKQLKKAAEVTGFIYSGMKWSRGES